MAGRARDARRDEILEHAVALLAERGYRDTTMLDIARRAAASKETLYAWFGDKQGLFKAAIQRNASDVQKLLTRHLADGQPPQDALPAFGAALLDLLLGESAVAINRAAIAEARSDPTLAETLATAGRGATLPLLLRYLDAQKSAGRLRFDRAEDVAVDFLGLLVGDLQVQRLLGVAPIPGTRSIDARARRATARFLALYGDPAALPG